MSSASNPIRETSACGNCSRLAGLPGAALLVVCAAVFLIRSAIAAEPAQGAAAAIDERLKLSVVPAYQLYRGQGPLNSQVRLQWTGPGLLEGSLLFDIYAGEKLIGHWQSRELAVSDQVLSIPLMLPPSPLNSETVSYAVQAVFESRDRRIRIDPRDVPVEPRWSRRFLLGIVAPRSVQRIGGFTATESAPQLSEIFQLANFHPDRTLGAEFNVSAITVAPEEMPVDPLRLTGLDLLLVSGEALADLTPPQFEAIEIWVRAGGRVCLVGLNPVPPALRTIWRRLGSTRIDEPIIDFDDQGIPRAIGGQPRVRARPGCGRTLCVLNPAAVDRPEWNEDLIWLFSVLQSQAAAIRLTGHWGVPAGPAFSMNYNRVRAFAPAAVPIADLMAALMPSQVHGISMWGVFLILLCCLLLIGPVDYCVLGWLGQRRLTWLLLPLVALACTGLMVRMSQSSLGHQSHVRSVSVADLGVESRVCRVSRFELEFPSVAMTKRLERTGVFRLDFQPRIVGIDMPAARGVVLADQFSASAEPAGEPVRYTGNVPGSYEYSEPLRQWSPRLFRETLFGPDKRIDATWVEQLDWDAIEALDWTEPQGRTAIAQIIEAAQPAARVVLRTGLQSYDCDPRTPITQFHSLLRLVADWTSRMAMNEAGLPSGLFGMIYERTPTGGPDFEDLAWLDPDERRAAVLLIGVDGDDAVVFRRHLSR